MSSGSKLVVFMVIAVGMIALGANAFKRQQAHSKIDPRIQGSLQELRQLHELIHRQTSKISEESSKSLDQLLRTFSETKGYEMAPEMAHIYYLKSIVHQRRAAVSSKSSRSEHNETLLEKTPLHELKIAHGYSQKAIEHLQRWREHWEGLNANQILERLKQAFSQDPSMASHPNLMIFVGGRADQLVLHMKHFDIWMQKFKKQELNTKSDVKTNK